MELLSTLAYLPSPSWDGFSIGPLKIHAYALAIMLGIVLALWLGMKRWKERGGNPDAIYDIAFWAIPFGLIGGRLYHVFSSPDAYFGPGYDGTGDPAKIIEIWNGGLGIWGAVALGAVGAWIATRGPGYRFSSVLDVLAPGILLAQAVGRWGNWFNQELFGAPTDLPWGLKVDPDRVPAGYPVDTLFHPTFLYESLWNIVGVIILLAIDRRWALRGGKMFWAYVAYYTLGRVWIEMLRIDQAEMITLFGVTARLNVWTSILMFMIAVAVLVWLVMRERVHPTADSIYRPGYPKTTPATAETTDVEVTDEKESSPTHR
ncbi:prolipoprotein diacylglyceryl transferase [Micrococcoides hystricis]|uniref:Phosphatidylglycerol--prolipoprotein diacylglyceryl transferase n=1 Tax=Micrococcoides hystricis TaxID=1572761 RepID=A0ABV6P721_9MICC